MEYDETVTEIDLKVVLREFPEGANSELDLSVEGWSNSFSARLLSLFRRHDG